MKKAMRFLRCLLMHDYDEGVQAGIYYHYTCRQCHKTIAVCYLL